MNSTNFHISVKNLQIFRAQSKELSRKSLNVVGAKFTGGENLGGELKNFLTFQKYVKEIGFLLKNPQEIKVFSTIFWWFQKFTLCSTKYGGICGHAGIVKARVPF